MNFVEYIDLRRVESTISSFQLSGVFTAFANKWSKTPDNTFKLSIKGFYLTIGCPTKFAGEMQPGDGLEKRGRTSIVASPTNGMLEKGSGVGEMKGIDG